MPTYIMLGNYTQQGLEEMGRSPERLEEVNEMVRAKGGEPKGFYLTLGEYDFVYIAELPSDEDVAELSIRYGGGGAGSTETLRAFSEDEYRDICGRL